MEKAICTQCREKVEYDVVENETTCNIHGEEVTYLVNDEIWVEDLEAGNVCRSLTAYLLLKNKEKERMEEKKYYEIRGYDSNFDWAGPHDHPLLAVVYGTEQEALEYAETLPGYRGGEHIVGYIKECKPNVVVL